jgi:hypothetical protein
VVKLNTTISISTKIKEQIIEFGDKGETYNEILERILNNAKERQLQDLLMNEKDTITVRNALDKAKERWQE